MRGMVDGFQAVVSREIRHNNLLLQLNPVFFEVTVDNSILSIGMYAIYEAW
jgi:hypothetical protein